MTPDEPLGVTPLVAVMLVLLVVLTLVLVLFVVSWGSKRFQRAQDERFTRAPSRTEWLRVNVGIWVRDVIDGIVRAFR